MAELLDEHTLYVALVTGAVLLGAALAGILLLMSYCQMLTDNLRHTQIVAMRYMTRAVKLEAQLLASGRHTQPYAG